MFIQLPNIQCIISVITMIPPNIIAAGVNMAAGANIKNIQIAVQDKSPVIIIPRQDISPLQSLFTQNNTTSVKIDPYIRLENNA